MPIKHRVETLTEEQIEGRGGLAAVYRQLFERAVSASFDPIADKRPRVIKLLGNDKTPEITEAAVLALRAGGEGNPHPLRYDVSVSVGVWLADWYAAAVGESVYMLPPSATFEEQNDVRVKATIDGSVFVPEANYGWRKLS